MKFREVLIGSSIVGLVSYIVSAVILPLLLKGDSDFNTIVKIAITTYQIIPVTIGLVIFLVYFSYYSLVDITPSTWGFSEKWDKFD
jgi:hypothetical protein